METVWARHAGKVIMETWREDAHVGHLDSDLSNMWQSIRGLGEAGWKCLCRIRYDGFWCGAYRHKLNGSDPSCRACGAANDSWAHAILRCEHAAVNGAITTRHNAALRALYRGLEMGRDARITVRDAKFVPGILIWRHLSRKSTVGTQ